ncbi:flagellar hook protein FlgE [Salinarimonas sp. NSM]|uniref:flagellar hook protein FlgE n=1 Tax=Salinarimonas sp. NSM TaxID=3458003 RepID=UPI004036672E
MSLYGVMRTGVSGMAAQSSKLATVADNIANANTNGYKRAQTEFSSLILGNSSGQYTSGGVTPTVRYAISQQGAQVFTTSSTDLAINGRGFFVVSDGNGTPYLTRAGSFVPNGEGELVNAAGFKLMGQRIDGATPAIVVNDLQGLQAVNIGQTALEATASTAGTFAANLDSNADAIAAPATLPSGNAATAAYESTSSLVAYDNLGNAVVLDVYFAKTGPNTWEATVFNRADAPAGGGFPYGAGPLDTVALTFDPADGRVTGAPALNIAIPGGQPLALDLSQMTQVGADYTVMRASVNGNAPSAIRDVEISDDGIVYAVFENGERRATWQLPLADVTSPDNLIPQAGNVYSLGLESGDVKLGAAGQGGLGGIVSGALEQSNVDLAAELTSMIESQRSYTANSKVFQTGSELLDVLVNLKR